MSGILVRAGLRFERPEDEDGFVERYVARHRVAIQMLAIACGILIYSFFITDRLAVPQYAEDSHTIRSLTMMFIIACAGLLSLPALHKHMEKVITVAFVAAYICEYLVFRVLHVGLEYSSGLLLVLLAAACLFPLRIGYFSVVVVGTLVATAATLARIRTFGGIEIVNSVSMVAAGGMCIFAVARRERHARAEYGLMGEIGAARERIEELLHSMLPREIVTRIQSGETAIADAYGEVTIVFADLVGFTALARRISAAHLVEMLNRFFSEFDAKAEAHGLERIKTIGDAYMAVGGLGRISPGGDHAKAAAHFALELTDIVARLADEVGLPFSARVGLHVGPVVAGVIGTKRPAFDCWGDTVNLASRLESVAKPGSVVVSETAYWRLKDSFAIRVLEEVDLKGIGLTKTYLLEPPPELSAQRPMLGATTS